VILQILRREALHLLLGHLGMVFESLLIIEVGCHSEEVVEEVV
jgi:hypothetical protein